MARPVSVSAPGAGLPYGGMPSYYDWNTALIEHVTHGAPLGSTVYLEVSDESLERIGVQRWGAPAAGTTWAGDFRAAVQESCAPRGRVEVAWTLRNDPRGRPLSAAFLGATVLAASHMASAGVVHERNYFQRLAEVLGVPLASQGRPPGLPSGEEEPLWRAWARFLRRRGYDSTARAGEGALRFIAYPISQSLLNGAERQRLARLFAERGYPAGWDGETLASRLRADGVPSRKLQELLQRTGAAAEDVQGALLDALQAFHASGAGEGTGDGLGGAWSARQLVAGLYRDEDWRGEVTYRLFPKQPRGVRLTDMRARLGGQDWPLQLERPGYYQPLGDVSAQDLHTGARFEVTGSPFVDALVLPARDFWLLREDPDLRGQFASLGTPGLGEHVLLLTRDTLLPDLRRFRDEGLLAWTGEPTSAGDGWVEVRDVLVTGNHWAEIPAGAARALHDALRPPGGVSVRLHGGVRSQRGGAYLLGGAPDVEVTSFWTDAHLTVCRDGQEVYAAPVTPNEPLGGLLDAAGEYEVTAESRGVRSVRLLTVLDWTALRAAPAPEMSGVTLGGAQVCGPFVWEVQA